MDLENKYLESFIKANKLTIEEKENTILITGLWDDDSFRLEFSKDFNFEELAKVKLPVKLYALQTSNKLEFIFQPLKSDFYCIDRKFSFVYNGKSYKAYYDAPSDVMQSMAKAFVAVRVENDDDITYRNLKPFYEFYNQELLTDSQKESFKELVPINFFVEGSIDELSDKDLIDLLQHLNFYMAYFDRTTPCIFIEDTKPEEPDYEIPCLSKLKAFPENISFSNIDSSLLDLLFTARKAPTTRLKYLYYYQVLEYASYYFVEDNFRNKIGNVLKSPDLLINTDKYSHILIEEFQNKYYKDHSDSLRLLQVIEKYCDYKKIRNELKTNKEYFLQEVSFDGGLKLKPLFKKEEQIDGGLPNSIQTIKDNLEQIRNVLVHIRESHENLVILPTARNERLIKPYLYLLRRIAEEVAIRYEYF